MCAQREKGTTKLTRLGTIRNWAQSQSAKWHQQIAKTAQDHVRSMEGSSTGELFPTAQLREHTDSFLRSKGKLSPEGREACLIALVKGHQEKDVAIVACAHALSPQTVKGLLRGELYLTPGNHTGAYTYLRALVTVSYVNPTAVSSLEAQWAQDLIYLFSSDVRIVSRRLQAYANNMGTRIPTDLLFYSLVDGELRKACANYAKQLRSLMPDCQWTSAHAASDWLLRLRGTSPFMEQLLDQILPEWHVWALWRPNFVRIRLLDCLRGDQRAAMRDVIALEGPDFITRRHATQSEGLVFLSSSRPDAAICHERLVIQPEHGSDVDARTILDRLLNTLVMTCSISPNALGLFMHLCLRNPVNSSALDLLDNVNATGDASASTAVLDTLYAQSDSIRVASVNRLLPILDGVRGQGLRNILSSKIIEIVENEMSRMQDKLCQQLETGRAADGTGKKLHTFGENLKNYSWLRGELPGDLQSVLEQWPSAEDITAIFKLRTDAQDASLVNNSSLTDSIDAYCMRRLAGQAESNDEAESLMEGLISLWRQPPDSQRRAVALAVFERSSLPPDIRRRCILQLSNMSEDFVDAVGRVVGEDTDMACVNFAHLLVRQRRRHTNGLEFWQDLLLSMIAQRSATLLGSVLTHRGKVESWFQWLENLKTLLGQARQDSPTSPPIFDTSLHLWAERLKKNYLPVLINLERSMGTGSEMRWILMGWDDADTIIPLLDALKELEQGQRYPATKAIMSFFNPDGSNARVVCSALSSLNGMTPPGKDALTRILQVQEADSKAVAEVLLAGWLSSTSLNEADKSALRVVAGVIGLRIPGDRGVPSATSLH